MLRKYYRAMKGDYTFDGTNKEIPFIFYEYLPEDEVPTEKIRIQELIKDIIPLDPIYPELAVRKQELRNISLPEYLR